MKIEELVELKFDDIVHATERAYLLQFDQERVWLPKSEVKIDEKAQTVECPPWLVEKNSLEQYEN